MIQRDKVILYNGYWIIESLKIIERWVGISPKNKCTRQNHYRPLFDRTEISEIFAMKRRTHLIITSFWKWHWYYENKCS